MSSIFTDPLLEKTFQEQGYVIANMLQPGDISQLLELFSRYENQFTQPFHTTHFSTDKEYKQQVNDFIIKIVAPRAALLLNDMHPVFGNFMIKQPDPANALQLHADWTYVNERFYRSVSIWAALVDTDEQNGCLGVIPCSHRVTNSVRGPNIIQTSFKYDKVWEESLGKLLPLKAGQVVIYDHALLHYSLPNKSDRPRPAINLSLVPAAAKVLHYCIPEGAKDIEMYEVNSNDFFIRYDNFQRPEINSLSGTFPADTVKWIDDRMNRLK